VSCCKPHEDILELVANKEINLIIVKSPLPFFEQIILPILILKYMPEFCWFPANSFPLIKLTSTKYIVTIHDVIFLKKNEKKTTWRQFFGSNYRKIVANIGIKNIDRITSVSMTSLQEIVESFGLSKKTLHYGNVLYNSTYDSEDLDNIIFSKLNINIDNTSFFYSISGSSTNKNLSFLINSFAKYLQQSPKNTKLIISGLTNKRERMGFQQLAEKNGIKNNIIFTDYISDSEKNSLFQKCDFFFFVSQSEGFGIPIIEALSQGCEIVASDIGIFHEVGDDYIHYIDQNDEDFLLKFISENHEAKYSKKEKKEYIRNKFNVQHNVEKIKSIITDEEQFS
jgi:glycosyltransferase involved in cell wall biosynthesis